MEAESYLTDGYGVRLAIEAKPGGWIRFDKIASASAPPRIKQILVSPDNGVPYLNTSQVFDMRPKPRKWLAMSKTKNAEARLIKEGTILVMASATVGRAIVATKAHENAIISHHFMRVQPLDANLAGWVYAYLRSPQAQAMMSGSQYASVIRHIEPHHLATLPVPEVSEAIALGFQKNVAVIMSCRNHAAQCTLDAETMFAEAVGPLGKIDWGETGFSLKLSRAVHGKRRLDAARYNPGCTAIFEQLTNGNRKTTSVRDAGFDVWVPGRYKRVSSDTGVLYMDSSEILEVNPIEKKRFTECGFGDSHQGRVEPGWILMPCSGQVYGIIGAAVLAGESLRGKAISNHVLRMAPTEATTMRAGYVVTALGHPDLGRPLIKALAFGASVPELDPNDVAEFPVVRLGKDIEDQIADLAEEATLEQARAETLERELSEAAGKVVSDFLLRPASLGKS
jgi:hypothetical protein